jgi:ankyrin repeat protein
MLDQDFELCIDSDIESEFDPDVSSIKDLLFLNAEKSDDEASESEDEFDYPKLEHNIDVDDLVWRKNDDYIFKSLSSIIETNFINKIDVGNISTICCPITKKIYKYPYITRRGEIHEAINIYKIYEFSGLNKKRTFYNKYVYSKKIQETIDEILKTNPALSENVYKYSFQEIYEIFDIKMVKKYLKNGIHACNVDIDCKKFIEYCIINNYLKSPDFCKECNCERPGIVLSLCSEFKILDSDCKINSKLFDIFKHNELVLYSNLSTKIFKSLMYTIQNYNAALIKLITSGRYKNFCVLLKYCESINYDINYIELIQFVNVAGSCAFRNKMRDVITCSICNKYDIHSILNIYFEHYRITNVSQMEITIASKCTSEIVNSTDRHGNTLLHYFCKNTESNLYIDTLLQLGANPNAKNNKGYKPIDFVYFESLSEWIYVRNLIECTDLSDSDEFMKNCKYNITIIVNNIDILKPLLRANFNYEDLLYEACVSENIDSVKLIVQYIVQTGKINIEDCGNCLKAACIYNNLDIMVYLSEFIPGINKYIYYAEDLLIFQHFWQINNDIFTTVRNLDFKELNFIKKSSSHIIEYIFRKKFNIFAVDSYGQTIFYHNIPSKFLNIDYLVDITELDRHTILECLNVQNADANTIVCLHEQGIQYNNDICEIIIHFTLSDFDYVINMLNLDLHDIKNALFKLNIRYPLEKLQYLARRGIDLYIDKDLLISFESKYTDQRSLYKLINCVSDKNNIQNTCILHTLLSISDSLKSIPLGLFTYENINYCDADLNTALHIACLNADMPHIDVLLYYYADVSAKNKDGDIPFYLLCKKHINVHNIKNYFIRIFKKLRQISDLSIVNNEGKCYKNIEINYIDKITA